MKKQIKWQKWVDPLTIQDQDKEIEDNQYIQHSISTQLGFIGSIKQSLIANNYYDFWILHTNFDITRDIVNCIKVIPGVETLDIFSRYTARVGISRSGFFDSEEVKNKISIGIRDQEQTKKYIELNGLPEPIAKEAINVINDMYDKYNNWIILILPNGKIESVFSNIEDDEFVSRTTDLKVLHNSIGGRLVSS